MKYFIDTEFIEYPNTIDLISIGIKCEDGRRYYAISADYNFKKASDWVVKNVITPIYVDFVPANQQSHCNIPNVVDFHKLYGKSINEIKADILEFVGFPEYENGKPEFWGYYCDYDWVVFCWIFGTMMDLPDGFPMYCVDLQQLLVQYNLAKLPDPDGVHNALADAEWNEELYNYIQEYVDSLK